MIPTTELTPFHTYSNNDGQARHLDLEDKVGCWLKAVERRACGGGVGAEILEQQPRDVRLVCGLAGK